MYITQKALSRRTILKGLGAAISLPFLDAMVPEQAIYLPEGVGMVPYRLPGSEALARASAFLGVLP